MCIACIHCRCLVLTRNGLELGKDCIQINGREDVAVFVEREEGTHCFTLQLGFFHATAKLLVHP